MKIADFLYAGSSWNVEVFHYINNIQEPLFQQSAHIASAMGKYTMFPVYLVVLILCAFAHGSRIKVSHPVKYPYFRENIKFVLISLIISFVVYMLWVSGLKHFLHMPRPFAILPEGSVFITESVKKAEDPYVSFPSGHASFAMLMLVSLWPVLNSFGKTAGVFLLLWVGISRIALGVHFPSDILGSYCLSFAITILTCEFIRRFCYKTLTK